ncbi:MAG: hypothetical protein AAGD07_09115 [Planctomycetota bacterium]
MKKLTNINRGPNGWTVRLVREGVEYSKYFRFSNGGVQKSKEAAIQWRDEQLRALGDRQWRKGPRKKPTNNTSGVTGVSRNFYGRWVATWQEDGKQRFKTFKSKREAIAHRKAQLARTLGE